MDYVIAPNTRCPHASIQTTLNIYTVVELLDGAYEVEFSDNEGKTYAELALQSDRLLILHDRLQHNGLMNRQGEPQ